MSLIALKTFENAIDAHQLKAKLESEDIFCVLQGEHLASIYPMNNITIQGVTVCVHKDDAEAALRIIHKLEGGPYTETEKEITCPNCGSTDSDFNSTRGFIGIITTILLLGLMVFPGYNKRVRRCNSCGHKFRVS